MNSVNNQNNIKSLLAFPEATGLYEPKKEHDACGFGFIANIYNQPKHEIVHQALEIVHNLDQNIRNHNVYHIVFLDANPTM